MRADNPIVRIAVVALLGLSASHARAQNSMEQGLVVASTAMVASDHELASEVGVAILEAGGNAADAAVAVGLTLGVVNPFASGIGGGGFLLWRDADSGEVAVLDFREVAPQSATPDMYIVDGEFQAELAQRGGLSVAVPGEVAGWWALHQRYGRLPWEDVVEPARLLAEDGFRVGSLLPDRLASAEELLAEHPRLASQFQLGDRWVEEGELLTRPELATTLRAIQANGPDGFYVGPVAADLVGAVNETGGEWTLDDLASYEVRWLEPIVSEYRGYTVYGMPPPSSGGIAIAQILNALSAFSLDRLHYGMPITVHIVMQAMAHAFADRATFLGDADFTEVPTDALLGGERTSEMVEAYQPDTTLPLDAYGDVLAPPDDSGTSHFSVVDADGNAVACTSTINRSFGSLVLGPRSGVLLNDEMDDFSAQPGVPNSYGLVGTEANAIEPGKRPLSSMSPTIVVRDGELVGTLGGSGGPMIITGTLLTLLQLIDFGRDAFEAVSAPRFHHQWLPFSAFIDDPAPEGWSALDDWGYDVEQWSFPSAIQVIWQHPDGWQAASDPRKHGVPAGY